MKFTAEINDKYVPGLADKFYQHDPNKEPLTTEQQENIVRSHYEEILKNDVSGIISIDPDIQAKEAEVSAKQKELTDLKEQKLAEAIPNVDAAALAAETKI